MQHELPSPRDQAPTLPSPYDELVLPNDPNAAQAAFMEAAKDGNLSNANIDAWRSRMSKGDSATSIQRTTAQRAAEARASAPQNIAANVGNGADLDTEIALYQNQYKNIAAGRPTGDLFSSRVGKVYSKEGAAKAGLTEADFQAMVYANGRLSAWQNFQARLRDTTQATKQTEDGQYKTTNPLLATGRDLVEFGAEGVVETVLPLNTLAMNSLVDALGIPPPVAKRSNAAFLMQHVVDWINEVPEYDKVVRLNQVFDALIDMRNNTNRIEFASSTTMIEGFAHQVFDADTGEIVSSKIDKTFGALDALPLIGGALKLARRGVSAVRRSLQSANTIRTMQALDSAMVAKIQQSIGDARVPVEIEQLAAASLPKAGQLPVEPTPAGVFEAASDLRAQGIVDDIESNLARLRGLHADGEVTAKTVRTVIDDAALAYGRNASNPGMSRVMVSPDGRNVTFEVAIGGADGNGFNTLHEARSFLEAQRKDGYEAVLKKRNGSSLDEITDPYYTVDQNGEFFVMVKRTGQVRPEDVAVYGPTKVVGARMLGQVARFLIPATAMFDKTVIGRLANAARLGDAITGKLNALANPVRRLSGGDKIKVGEMLQWASDIGEAEGRNISWRELNEKFPDMTDAQREGFRTARLFYDAVYDINNGRLYDDWLGQGYVTAVEDGVRYHGATRSFDGLKEIYDPVSKTIRPLTVDTAAMLEQAGFRAMRLPTAIEQSDGALTKTILVKNIRALDQQVLDYIPGYVPRIYRDRFLVHKVHIHDENLRQAVAVAPTEAEALAFETRLNANSTDRMWRYEAGPDSALTAADRTASDLDLFRTEGRLFFDQRQKRLVSTRGGLADIEDPINMLQRTAAMIGRQVSMEDVLKFQKAQWGKEFGHFVPNWTKITASEVRGKLVKAAAASSEAKAALATWDHLSFLESGTAEFAGLRSLITKTGAQVSRLLGAAGLKRASLAVARKAGESEPITAVRSVVAAAIIAARPIRQRILNAMQATFVWPTVAFRAGSALNGLSGKFFIDTTGLKKLAMLRARSQMGLQADELAAHEKWKWWFGWSDKEMNKVVTEFENSGLLQGIDVQSVAGSLGRASDRVPTTTAGRVGQAVAAPVKGVFRAGETYGFVAGEAYGRSAAFMASLRGYLSDTKKTVGALKNSDWVQIHDKARALTLDMSRANQLPYQRGWLSLATQFLSFTHKALALELAALPVVGKKLVPVGMTQADVQRIVVGQMVLFGGTMFGDEMGEWVDSQIESVAPNMNPDLRTIVKAGLIDYALDKLAQTATGDPDVDVRWSAVLAPGGGFRDSLLSFAEVAAGETTLPDWFLGPTSRVGSDVLGAVQSSRLYFANFDDDPAMAGTALTSAIAEGVHLGFSDAVQGLMMLHYEHSVARGSGKLTAPADALEAGLKALAGFTTEQRAAAYEIAADRRRLQKELDDAVKVWAGRVRNIDKRWNSGQTDFEQHRRELSMLYSVLNAAAEKSGEVEYLHNALVKELLRADEGSSSIIDGVVDHYYSGLPVDENLRRRIKTIPGISDEDRNAALELIDRALAIQPAADAARLQQIEQDVNKDNTNGR